MTTAVNTAFCECVTRQFSPASLLMTVPPNCTEAISVDGSDGAIASEAMGRPASSGSGLQEAPPLTVLNTPSKVAA